MQTMWGGDNGAQMAAALSGMVRSIIDDYESRMSRLEDGADDYEEPSLEESNAQASSINKTYRNIRDMLPINLHGQPACPQSPSLVPVPTKRANLPVHPGHSSLCYYFFVLRVFAASCSPEYPLGPIPEGPDFREGQGRISCQQHIFGSQQKHSSGG